MSENETEDPRDDIEHVTLKAEFLDSDADAIVVRQVYVGLSPAVYLEPELSEDGTEMILNLTAVDITPDELADTLELVIGGLREGTLVPPEETPMWPDREGTGL